MVHEIGRRTLLTATLGVAVPLTAVADPTPVFATGKGYALIYLAAWDCPPCIQWQNNYKDDFFGSPQFKKLTYRKIDSPRIKEAYDKQHWPPELDPLRQFIVGKGWHGVPRFIFLNNGILVATNSGISGWESEVWPAMKKTIKA